MQEYILNKKIKGGKVNDVNDLKGISKAAWGFISSLYNSGWDELIANNNKFSFRCEGLIQPPNQWGQHFKER